MKSLKQKAEEFLNSNTVAVNITKVTLAIVAVGGLLVIGAVAPNLVQLLKGRIHTKHYSSKQLQKAYHNLKYNGFVEIKTNQQGKSFVCLTKKGERKLANLDLDSLVIVKPKKWDGKWRVLMFDLPVRFRKAREAFRWKIKNLGFWQLQKSVWVYPYLCEEEMVFVAEFFGVTKHIEILTVEKLLREDELKKHFNL